MNVEYPVAEIVAVSIPGSSKVPFTVVVIWKYIPLIIEYIKYIVPATIFPILVLNTIEELTARPVVLVHTILLGEDETLVTFIYIFPISPDGSGKFPADTPCVPGHNHPDVPEDKFPLSP